MGKFLETFIVAFVIVIVLCNENRGCAGDNLSSLILVQLRLANLTASASESAGGTFILRVEFSEGVGCF